VKFHENYLTVFLCVLCAALCVRAYKLSSLLDHSRSSLHDIEESCRTLEEEIAGKDFDNYIVLNQKGAESSLYDAIDSSKDPVILFVTSLSNCNLCRDKELDRWNKAYSSNQAMKLRLIVCEPVGNLAGDKRKLVARANGMAEFPFFLETSGNFIQDLYLTPEQTPLILVVQNHTVIAAHRPTTELEERSRAFCALVKASVGRECHEMVRHLDAGSRD